MTFYKKRSVEEYVAESQLYKDKYMKVQQLASDAGLDKKFELSTQEIAIQYLIKHPLLESDQAIIQSLSCDILPNYSAAISQLLKIVEAKFVEFKIAELLPLDLHEVTKEIIGLAKAGCSSVDDAMLEVIFDGMMVKKGHYYSGDGYQALNAFLAAIDPFIGMVAKTEKAAS